MHLKKKTRKCNKTQQIIKKQQHWWNSHLDRYLTHFRSSARISKVNSNYRNVVYVAMLYSASYFGSSKSNKLCIKINRH